MATAKIFALFMIVTTMLGAGLQVNLQHVTATLRLYNLLLKALILNFVLVPLFAWLLISGFHVQEEVSIGILLMAMSPGVPFLVNSAGRKQGGSLAFVLVIAFLFSALSVLTIPITAALLLPHNINVPAVKFLTTLLGFQLLPLILGAVIGPRLSEKTADTAIRVLHIVFLIATLGLVVLIGPKLISSVTSVYGFGQLAIIAAIGLFALAAGWLLGGPDSAYRRTLSIGTLMRNIGLCALVGTSEFADTLVLPTVISYFAITFILSLPVRMYFKRSADAAAAH
jgi:bile acid:Na+ symporter, BASS family